MSDVETQFRSLVLEGVFQEKEGVLSVLHEGKEVLVGAELEPFKGRMLRAVIHYAPPSMPDSRRWGMGCCTWQDSGRCPAGHHENPGKMLVFKATGVLEGNPWRVGDMPLPMADLPGHRARLILVTDFTPPKLENTQDLSTLVDQMAAMRQFLAGLVGTPKEKS